MIKDITINATRARESERAKPAGCERRDDSRRRLWRRQDAVGGRGQRQRDRQHSAFGHRAQHDLQARSAQRDGEPANVIIKDWQVDPVKGRLLHADLLRLSMTEVTRVSVA